MTALEIRTIIATGGGVVVDASQFSTLDLRTFASAAKTSHTFVHIKNASCKSTLDCRTIANAGSGHVLFDFT